MLNKLLTNKKIAIVMVAVFLLVIALIIGILASNGTKEKKQPNLGRHTEADKDHGSDSDEKDVKNDSKSDNPNGADSQLNVKKENGGKSEGHTDVSGLWEESPENKLINGNEGKGDGNHSGDTKDVTGNDTLSDDKEWGRIY